MPVFRCLVTLLTIPGPCTAAATNVTAALQSISHDRRHPPRHTDPESDSINTEDTRLQTTRLVILPPRTQCASSISPARAVRKPYLGSVCCGVGARSPLILSVMARNYRGYTFEMVLTGGNLDERRHHLFTVYVARMTERRGREPGLSTAADPRVTMQARAWRATRGAKSLLNRAVTARMAGIRHGTGPVRASGPARQRGCQMTGTIRPLGYRGRADATPLDGT